MVDQQSTYLILAEAGGLVLALLTANAVFRAYFVSRARPLALFGSGFLLLALAQASAALLEWYASRVDYDDERFDRVDALFWLYFGSFILGLVLIFLSFGRKPFKWTPALVPLLLRAAPGLNLLTLVAMFFVVLHAGLNHIARARAGSLQTAFGFFLLMVGQFLALYQQDPLAVRTLYGEVAAVVGYFLLYLAVARPIGAK